jgi:hypothetical protein
MPDSPFEAKFWKGKEKEIAIERLRANQMGIVSREWRWDHVVETLLDLKTYCWAIIIICVSFVLPIPSPFQTLLTIFAELLAEESPLLALSSFQLSDMIGLQRSCSIPPLALSNLLLFSEVVLLQLKLRRKAPSLLACVSLLLLAASCY